MKKLSLALITGGALCAFGVLLGGAALAMTGFEFSKVVTTMKYENKTAAYEPSLLNCLRSLSFPLFVLLYSKQERNSTGNALRVSRVN